jgi:glycosyltransferase involved in cell wall biosynthesis
MNSQPLVSIIIPTYNRAHLIGETLDSVEAQTYQNWECIIVDDGSSDNTDEVIGEYVNKDLRFKYYHRPEEHLPGGNGARNYGFKMSKGEYVNWFDSDDLMSKEFLKAKFNLFTSDKIFFTICSGCYLEDNSLSGKFYIDTSNLFKDYVKWQVKIFISSVLFRRDFLINKILFNEKIIKNQEIELFSRLFFKVKKDSFKIIDEPLFFYRRHVDTKSNLDKSYRRNIKRDVAYIHLKNLKRAQEIKDQELVKYLYKKNIKMIFSALKNNHKENAVYVYNDLFQSLNKKNKYVFFKLWVLVIFLSLKQKKIENHFKYAKVKI